MNQKIKYLLIGLVFWFLMFLGWEWWRSYPRVRIMPTSNPETPEEKIDSLLIQSLNQFLIPGLAVGIIEEEKVTYLKAFGFENLETKDSLTLKSRIPVASISKIFTALSLANYALENEISITQPVNSILPDGQKLGSEFSQVTLLDLLHHTSGLKIGLDINHLLPSGRNKPLELLPESLKTPDLSKKEYHYADINFDLIGYLLENASGIPFETLSQERVLSQGGVEESAFVTNWPLEDYPLIGYHRTFLWKRLEPRKLNFQHVPSPSAGLFVTAEDLSKALLHLSRGEMGTFSDELSWLKNDSETPAGFQNITLNNTKFIGHYGEQGGYSSLLIYSPELDLALFLISNGRDQADFRNRISVEILKTLNP